MVLVVALLCIVPQRLMSHAWSMDHAWAREMPLVSTTPRRRTDNSAKSLARSTTDRQISQITGTLVDGQTLPNQSLSLCDGVGLMVHTWKTMTKGKKNAAGVAFIMVSSYGVLDSSRRTWKENRLMEITARNFNKSNNNLTL